MPTLNESGHKGFQVTIWHGLYGPKNMPADVSSKINAALKAALKDPDFIKKQEGLGAVVVTDKRVEASGTQKICGWLKSPNGAPIIKAAGVYAD